MTGFALSRRALVGASGALMLPGCAGRLTLGSRSCSPLPPVRVEESRIIRQVVGLRPYRPSGFNVSRDADDPRVIHNYGHGGGGITLSWGSSRLAVDLGLPGHSGRVAVIGGGVMGLTTARLIQEAGFPVTLYTAALPPDTTSNIAGGQWHPAFVFDEHQPVSPAFAAQFTAACDYSYRRFQIMVGSDYGVRWMRNHDLADAPPEHPDPVDEMMPGMLPENRVLRPSEHPFPFAYARQWDGPMVETPVFLRAMLRDIQLAGAEIVIRKFETRAQVLDLPQSLIFNCTGLGAGALFNDPTIYPVRGQLVLLEPQPEVTYAINAHGPTYMFSRSDAIILGGTSDHHQWDTTVNPAVTEAILARHRAIFDRFRCT